MPDDVAGLSAVGDSRLQEQLREGVEFLKAGDLDAARSAFLHVIKATPDNSAAHLGLGQVHLQEADLHSALRCFATAVAHNPNSRLARVMLAGVREKLGEADASEIAQSQIDRLLLKGARCLKAGNLDAARAVFSELVETDPENSAAHLGLGKVHMRAEDLQSALLCFQKALALDPKSPMAKVMLARAREQLGEADESEIAQRRTGRALLKGIRSLKGGDLNAAHAAFSEAIETKPETAAAHLGLGQAYMRQGDLQSALEFLQTAVELDPNSSMAKMMLARVREQLGQADASEIARRRTSRTLIEGFRSLKAGDLDAARAAFSEVIETNPETSAAHLGLGRVHVKEENLQAALQCFETAVALDPSSSMAKIMRARVREKLGDTDAAMEDYEDASELDPSRSFAQRRISRIFAENEDYAGAVERLRDTVQRDPQQTATRFMLANLLERSGDTAAAKIELQGLLDLKPDMWVAAYQLGRLHVGDEEHGAACPLLEKAVQLAPDKPAPRLVLGAALKGLGQYERALAVLKEAEQLGADSSQEAPIIPSSLTIMIADCEIKLGQPEQALRSLRQALRDGRQPAFLHKRLGDVLMILERHREAIEEYRAAVMREQDLAQKQPELRPLFEQADAPGQDPEPLAKQIQSMVASIFAAKRDEMKGRSPAATAIRANLEPRRGGNSRTE